MTFAEFYSAALSRADEWYGDLTHVQCAVSVDRFSTEGTPTIAWTVYMGPLGHVRGPYPEATLKALDAHHERVAKGAHARGRNTDPNSVDVGDLKEVLP